MFFPGSRYEGAPTYTVTRPDGTQVTAVRLPLPRPGPLLGFHRRLEAQRLDLIAHHYLADPTTFWRLCDANGALSPDALAARELVGIPAREA
jgi:hypothetical protein